MAFALWCAVSCVMIVIGIMDIRSDKPAGFWANVDMTDDIENVKAYNLAVGRMFIIYGIVLIVFGLPLLQEKPGVMIILTMMGTVFSTLVLMVVYMVFIHPKFSKKKK